MSVFAFPSTVRLHFDWEGETPGSVAYKLARLEAYIENPSPLLEGSKEILQTDLTHKFETETDPSGAHWDELVKPEPQQIGILRRGSTDAQMYRDAISDEAWSISPQGVEFNAGALPAYWVYHEQPDRESQRIPRREFIGPTAEAQEKIEAFGLAWLDAGVARATGKGMGRIRPRDPATGRFIAGG